jgi:tetratricopeptide (TPR) repeat protein
VTRVPRPKDVKAFDQQMKQRFILEVPRLYYLFADSELATTEYIAMDRSAEKAPSILTDYVELFATLNPKGTLEYIQERLTSFREGLTLRKEADSRRVIQELLTLFPRAEVYLEAARYYRLVKEAEESIVNYIHYLQSAPDNKEIILEFAEVCAAAPQAAVTEYSDAVVRHLETLGPNLMEPQTLSLFCALAKSPEQLQSIVASIEGDPSRLSVPQFRSILFRALNELQQWDRLVAIATDIDLKDVAVQRILAKAYAKLHTPDKALQIIHRLPLRDPTEILPLMEILYDLRADASKNDIRKAIQENRHLNSYVKRYSTSFLEHPNFSGRDGEFRSWVRDLFNEKN